MGFGRKRNDGRPRYRDLDAPAKAEAADDFLAHLVDVTTQAALDGTEEAKRDAIRHIANDLRGNERGLLEAALGKAVMLEGNARAEHMKGFGQRLADALLDSILGDGTQAGQERPTDLLPDDEPATAPEAVSEPQDAEEKVWTEDRR